VCVHTRARARTHTHTHTCGPDGVNDRNGREAEGLEAPIAERSGDLDDPTDAEASVPTGDDGATSS
jgi:hypothetical protein